MRFKYVFIPRILTPFNIGLLLYFTCRLIWVSEYLGASGSSMIIEAIQCKLNSFLSHNVAHNRLLIVLLHVSALWWDIHASKRWYPKICCYDPHGIVFLILEYFHVLWVHEQFKSNENPANGRGVLLMFLWSWNISIKCSQDLKTYKSSSLL